MPEDIKFVAISDFTKLQSDLKLTNRYLLKMSNTLLAQQSIMNRNAQATRNMGAATRQAKSSTKNLGIQMYIAGAALMATRRAFRYFLDTVRTGITDFRAFEKEIAEIETLLTGVDEVMKDKLTVGVISLSKEFGFAAKDLTRGLYDIISATVPAGQAMDFLRIATKASIAGLATVAQSVDILTSLYNAYGFSVSQLQHVSDVLFTTVKYGKLHFEELASAIGYVTPIAAQVGIAFDEIAAAFATATRHGLHVDMVSRGLALTIQNIIKPTAQAAETANKYNFILSQGMLAAKGLQRFLEDMGMAVEGNAALIGKIIPNMRSLRVAMILAGDASDDFAEDVSRMGTSLGATEQAFIKMTDTAQFHADVIEQWGKDASRIVGELTSDFELLWKKTEVWLKVWAAGGDPWSTLDELDERLKGIDERITEMRVKTFMDAAGVEQPIKSLFAEIENMFTLPAGGMISAVDMELDPLIKYLKDSADEAKPFMEKMDEIIAKKNEVYGEKGLKKVAEELPSESEVWDNYIKSLEEDVENADNLFVRTAQVFKLGGTQVLGFLGKFSSEVGKRIAAIGRFEGGMEFPGTKEWSEEFNVKPATEQVEDLIEEAYGVKDAFDFWAGGVKDMEDHINNLTDVIIKLKTESSEIEAEIIEPFKGFGAAEWDTEGMVKAGTGGMMGWKIAVKETEMALGDLRMAVNLGSEDAEYAYLTQDKTLKGHIATIREYSEEQKKAGEATDIHTKAIKYNSLEMMKIQLKGMKRRRGLTRGEERKIKQLQIQNMQERIGMTEIEMASNVDALKDNYDTAKTYVDKRIRDAEFELFMLKDTRQLDIDDMKEALKTKLINYDEYQAMIIEKETELEVWQVAHGAAMVVMEETWGQEVLDTYEQYYGIKIPEEVDKSIRKLQELNMWQKIVSGMSVTAAFWKTRGEKVLAEHLMNTKGFQRGTYFVPKDMPAMLHRGETVAPAGRQGEGSTRIHIDPMTINANISSDTDVESLVQKIEGAIQTGLISGITTEYD